MLRLAILEWRLALSQNLPVLMSVIAMTALLSGAQEPWFLRSRGLLILWDGTSAACSVCFLAGSLAWLHQVQERMVWCRILARDTSWPLASGLALSAYGIAVFAYGFAFSAAVDLVGGDFGSLDDRVAAVLPWLACAMPVAFLTPGLAFVPVPAWLRTLLSVTALAASASLLDPGGVPANLLGPLLAGLGSAMLSASLQRASINWTLHAARHPR